MKHRGTSVCVHVLGELIAYRTGNLLETQAEALVNTVNEVGVIGEGVHRHVPVGVCGKIPQRAVRGVSAGLSFESQGASVPRGRHRYLALRSHVI